MDLSLGKAFAYTKADPKAKSKIFIGGLLFLLAALIYFGVFVLVPILMQGGDVMTAVIGVVVIAFAMCFLLFAVYGYYAKTINSKMFGSEILPEWSKMGEMASAGFKVAAGSFLYFLPFILIELFLFLIIFPTMKDNPLLPLPLSLANFVINAIASVFYPIMLVSFASDLKILSFVDYPRAGKLLKNNVVNYVLLLAFIFIISLVMYIPFFLGGLAIGLSFIPFGLGMLLMPVGIAILLAGPFVFFWLQLVLADIHAQFGKTKPDLIKKYAAAK